MSFHDKVISAWEGNLMSKIAELSALCVSLISCATSLAFLRVLFAIFSGFFQIVVVLILSGASNSSYNYQNNYQSNYQSNYQNGYKSENDNSQQQEGYEIEFDFVYALFTAKSRRK